MPKIRPYSPSDKPRLLQIMQLLTPGYFAEAEITDYAEYLENRREQYFVITADDAIVAGGGINFFLHEGTARLSWDLVHPDYHGTGIGRLLVYYRLNFIKNAGNVEKVVVRTTQVAYKFYEKTGFLLRKIEPDFWVAGFDLYLMDLKIADFTAIPG